MKKQFATLLGVAAFALASGVVAGESLMKEDFEDQTPGKMPSEWVKFWGEPGDDSVAVTNEQAASGEKSLLIKRAGYAGQWGFGFNFPSPDAGSKLTLGYKFRYEGPGSQAHIGFELRDTGDGGNVLLGWNVADNKFQVRPRNKNVMALQAGKWYSVVIQIPAAVDETAYLTVTDEATGKSATAEVKWPKVERFAAFYVNMQPQKKDFKFFLDDITLTQD